MAKREDDHLQAYLYLMDGEFLLPVLFEREELELKTKFVPRGYIYCFEVEVNGTTVSFEKDEEGLYRAMSIIGDLSIKPELLPAIATSLEAIAP